MLRKAFIAVLFVLFSATLFAEPADARVLTRDEALSKIIDDAIDVDVDQVRLYITREPVETGAPFLSWKRAEMTAPARGWFAFIDDHPTANFEHACRYIFVDEESGEIEVVPSTVPPKELMSLHEYPTEIGKRLDAAKQVAPKPYQGPRYGHGTRGNVYAVLLSGGADQGNNHIRYWNDMSNIYIALTEVYEFPDENIFVLMSDGTNPAPDRSDGANSPPDLDGDGDDDTLGPCVLNEIEDLFAMLEGMVGSGDQLFVFSTDHGGSNGGWSTYLNLWNWEELDDNVLEGLVNDLPQCNMIFTMEQCFSGGFEDNLAQPYEGRVFSSACSYTEYSWAMPPDYQYDTYVFFWTAAVKGEDAYGVPCDADYNDDGVVTMDEAFLYAEAEDFSDETPQYHSNPADLGMELSLWGSRSYIEGFVTDAEYGNPLIAMLRIVGGSKSTTSDATGYYELGAPDDTTVTVAASSYGYRTQEQDCYVPPDSSAWLDFALEEALNGLLVGWVRSALDGQPIEGAEVSVLNTPLAPVLTNEEGLYWFSIPGGATYEVEAVMPTYIGETRPATIAENDTTVLSFALGQAESFEENNGGYTGMMLWEWGIPSSYGPGGAHWGTHCWATNLDGPYGNNANSPLYSKVYDLAEATSAVFNFYHWYSTEAGKDGGNVKISIDGGSTWILITPEDGYPTSEMYWNGEPGYTGVSGGWELVSFDLSDYIGQEVKFKFTFGSDGSGNGPGWYIDDAFFEIAYPVSVSLVPDSQTVPKGTFLGFTVNATNAADHPIVITVWSEVLLPSGTPYWGNPIWGPYSVSLPAQSSPSAHLQQFVPGKAPLGDYTYIMKVGQYEEPIYTRDFFDFTVIP
jgi:hypothetical protein